MKRTGIAAGMLLLLSGMVFATVRARADTPRVVTYGPSDAQSIVVISGQPGAKNVFWWDHTHLTVSVRAGNSADADKVQALRDAVEVWHTELDGAFQGAISLTDVTGTPDAGQPDIILRYVPHAGGTQWGGVANCGVQKCLNVIVRSETAPGHDDEPDHADFDALRVERLGIHELGHALGLGHAAPLTTSLDVMGYGWSIPDPDLTPILSDCDIAGIRAAFGWVFANEPPHPATVESVAC